MKFLKDPATWKRWVKKVGFAAEWESEPKEYPCFAYAVVASWGYEEEQPVYVYWWQVEEMVRLIKGVK